MVLDSKRISLAIEEVEKHTEAELVVMVARRSSVTGHVSVIITLICLCIGLIVYHQTSLSWIMVLSLTVESVVAGLLLSKISFVQRVLTSNHDEQVQVLERAQHEFYFRRLNETRRHKAVLVFVSLMERRAVVWADQNVFNEIPQNEWQKVLRKLLTGIRKQGLNDGLVAGVEAAGEILREKFPGEGVAHELPPLVIDLDSKELS